MQEPDAFWNDQFPYAQEYMQETTFYNPNGGLGLPQRWDTESWLAFLHRGFDIHYLSPSYLEVEIRGSDGMASTLDTAPFPMNPTCPRFYWEVEITVTQPHWGSTVLGIGFHDNMLRLFKWSYPNLRRPIPAIVTDVLGCGLFFPYGIFFTQNGKLIDIQTSCPSFEFGLRACIQVDQGFHTATKIDANFGQKSFSFDIVTYCKSFTDRIRRRWATLPMEVLEEILAFILLTVDVDMGSEDPIVVRIARRTLSRISSVCRRWLTLCEQHIFPTLTLTRGEDVGYTLAQPTVWNARRLVTHEGPRTLWIHCLLTSLLPNHLTHVKEWGYTSSEAVPFNHRLHPRISHGITSFLRRGCFAHITRLTLISLRFGTWLHFARFVFSIPQLDELSLNDVAWEQDKTSLNPPRWIRFSRRIRTIKFTNQHSMYRKEHVLGLLCLIIAGRRSPTLSALETELQLVPQHVATIACILQALLLVTDPNFDNILHEQKEGMATLTCFRTSPTPGPGLVLTFVRHPLELLYQLAHIEATIDIGHYYPDRIQPIEPVAASLLELSNPAGCSCRFDVRNGLHNPWFQLWARWCIHKAFADDFRVDVAYDLVASQLWSFDADSEEDQCPIDIVDDWKIFESGQHVTIIWAVPLELRSSPPRVTLLLRRFVRGENVKQAEGNQGKEAEEEEDDEEQDDDVFEWWYTNEPIKAEEWENGEDVPAEYTVRHIANLDMGVADVVLPELQTRSKCVFEITLNGCVCRSEPVKVQPRPRQKTLQSSETL